MKTSILVLLAVSALAAASVLPEVPKRPADKTFLQMQKNFLQLLVRPHQFNKHKEQFEHGKNYHIEADISSYTNVKAVKQFYAYYKQGLMPKFEVFTVFNKEYLEQAMHLFEVFYYAKDIETFYKAACWARDHVNGGMFVYAFSIAVMQRPDCKDFVLPPPYEVYPNLFVNSETIHRAYEVKMQGKNYNHVDGVYKEDKTYFVSSNYSGFYYPQYPEQFVSYFTEDVGLNAFQTYWHMEYPFWFNSKAYNSKFDRRGELFYYTQHQLMARYYLERLSNGLGEVYPFSYTYPTPIAGFEPNLHYTNGKSFPMRPRTYDFFKQTHKFEALVAYEKRIYNAIDYGFFITEDGQKVTFKGNEGFNYLGNMVTGYYDSPNYRFYGNYYTMMMSIFGHITDPYNQYDTAPGALAHFSTSLRDPAYYTLYKRIDHMFKHYKEHLPYYTRDELTYPGVKIESVDVDKLVTYFDYFNFDLDNAVSVGSYEDGEFVDIQARQFRLNHKPYTFKVKVSSDKAATVMVRVFLGPKYDSFGRNFTLDQVRDYMVELDRFTYKMNAGSNVIERSSIDSSVATSDRTSYRKLFYQVEKALKGEEQFFIDETDSQCGYPQRLLLPKGKKEGMPFRFFVMVTPFDEKVVTDTKHLHYSSVPYCGVGKDGFYPDSYPMGFPFDREIKFYDYFYNSPNIYFKDVNIFHKRDEVPSPYAFPYNH